MPIINCLLDFQRTFHILKCQMYYVEFSITSGERNRFSFKTETSFSPIELMLSICNILLSVVFGGKGKILTTMEQIHHISKFVSNQ